MEFLFIQSDGAALATSIDRPEGAGPHPVVVMVHGLTGGRIGKSYYFVEFARRLAQRGIAVVRFDQSGCGESSGRFIDLTIPRMVGDTRAVCDWLADQPWCDAGRLGLVGVSLGALPAIAVDAERRAAAVALWAPVYDMPRVFARTAKTGLRAMLEHQGWVPYRGLRIGKSFVDHLAAVDAAAALADGRSPLLLLHSEADEVVRIEESQAYQRRCAELDRPCELVTSRTADHDFFDYPDRQFLLARTSAFFQTHLLDG